MRSLDGWVIYTLVGTLALGGSAAAETSTSAAPTTGQIEVPADHKAPRSAPPLKLYFERMGGPRSGKKPAIILHGGPGAAPPIFQILRGSAPGQTLVKLYDLVYFHQRGAGKSLLPDEAKLDYVVQHKNRYLMAEYVEDIELIRKKAFGPATKVTLIGSSWGGFSGLAYALKYQNHVDALILGSFEATSGGATSFCQHGDRILIEAEAQFTELRAALQGLRSAMVKRKIIWHRGKKDQRLLLPTDLLEMALPLIYKGRHKQLAAVLRQLTRGGREAQALLDELKMDETSTAGGSVPGTASFCAELLSKPQLEMTAASPPAALFADCGKMARGLLKLCAPFFAARTFDVERELPRLKVPALILAGRWDPVLPWEATARTAAKMKNATFLLMKGGHTPFDEGGACFAKIIESLAARRYSYDLSCL